MSHSADRKWLSRQVAIALMAGAVSIVPQVAYGMPQGGQTIVGGATGMDTPSGGTMNIISSAENNVIGWQDFSIQHGEKVQFDNKNYLNLVQGKGSSFIDGELAAGGGNIYLVNPNGVIFGKGSRVNVGSGNLYVSTQDTAALAAQYENSHSWDGANPLTAHAGLTDVVNLGGTISANSVTVEGNNIRFTNADHVTVTAAGGINLNTNAAHAADGNGYVHVGYDAAVNDAYNAPTVKTTTAKAAELTAAGWKVNGSAIAKANAYMLVNSAVQLQNIKDTSSENYMLGQDIYLSSLFTPIANFTGNFDGNFYTIHDLEARGTNAGLFADVTGNVASPSRLENVILNNPRVSGEMTGNAGGLVGVATNVWIQNVGITGNGLIQTIPPDYNRAGGIVGAASGTTIQRCYNSVQVEGGGIAGTVHQGTALRDVYNNGKARYGIFVDNGNVTAPGSISIQRIYTINQIGTNGAWGSTVNTFVNQANSATWLTVPTPTVGDPVPPAYSAFAAAFGSAIGRNGGEQTTWRMHEGAATPVLTAFYRGTVAVKYDYAMGDSSLPGGIHHQGKNWAKPNYHPHEVYNGENLVLDNVQYSYGNTGDSDVVTANHGTGGDTGLRNVKRDSAGNAAAYVLFQSGQYDIAGGDFTIQKRKLSGKTDGTLDQVEKEYDGTSDAAAASGPVIMFPAQGNTGVIEEDKAHVRVTGTVTGTFYRSKAAYDALGSDKTAAKVTEVGKNYYVTLNYSNLALTDDGSGVAQNYDFNILTTNPTASSEHGMITPRNIKLNLTQKTNLGKTYDGTTNIVNPAYAPQNNIADNLLTQKISGDKVKVEYGGAAVAYDNKNASTTANDRKVNYTGMTLSGSDRKNYRLVDENGKVLFYHNDGANNGFDNVENNTSPALVGTGTILRRTVKADGFVMQNGQGQPVTPSKEYDATSAYTLPAGHSIVQNASGDSGVIAADKPYIRFEPGTGAKFLDSSGTETADASNSGYTTAATHASFDITAKADGHEDLLDNYTYDTTPTVSSASIRTGTGAAKIAGRIEKKNIHATLNQTTGINKVYDGTDAVKLTNNVNLPGLLSDGTAFSSSAAYEDKHVAWDNGQPAAKRITYTITLTGSKANNYTLNDTTGATAALSAQGTITPKKLTAKFSDVTKVYDGTTKVTDPTLTLTTDSYNGNGGVIAGDTVTLTKTGASYASKHVKDNKGQPKTVTYTGLALDNRDYQLVDDSGDATTTGKGNGTITQATVGAGDIVWNWQKDAGQNNVPITKVYDNEVFVAGNDANGNTVGVGTYLRSVGVRFGSGSDAVVEDLATSDHSGAYASKNSQNKAAQQVAFRAKYDGPTTSHPDADADYVVADSALTGGYFENGTDRTGVITPRTVTVALVNHNSTKTYDGNANVVDGSGTLLTGNGLVTMTGLLADGTVNASTAQYTKNGVADKHVAVDGNGAVVQKDVTYTIQTTGGADASNYQFAYNGGAPVAAGGTVTGRGTINKKQLTVTFADVSKQYDGKAEVRGIQTTDQAAPTFIGLVTGDGHDDTKIKGVYGQRTGSTFTANANAGTKDVEYTGIADALGGNANNYAVQNMATISHGGGTTVQALFGAGTIHKRNINAAGVKFGLQNDIDKEYDGNANVLDPRSHIVGGAPYVEIAGAGGSTERLTLDYNIDSAQYDSKDVAYSGGAVTTKTVTYTVKLTGDSLNNFTVIGGTPSQFTKTATGTITPRKVVAVAAGTLHKVYDGNVNVPGSGDSVVTFARRPGDTGDALVGGTANTSTAQYVSKNVNRDGAGNVIGQGITFTATVSDSGNYEIDTSGLAGKTGIISPKGIKAEFKPVTKEYDGNTTVTDPAKGLVDSVASQKSAGDALDLNTDYDAQYRSPNVKDNRPGTQDNVVYSHLRLTGSDAGNYQLTDKNGNALAVDPAGYSHTTGNGIITQKVLTGTNLKFFFKPIEKEYNATRGVENAQAGIDYVELDGTVSNIVYTVKKAQYDTKDVGTGKQVEYTIGLDTDNYDISSLAGVDPTSGTFTATAMTGKITPKTITAVVQENTAITKTYDTTKAVVQAAGDVKKNVTIAGLLSDKDGSGYTVSAEYTDENAGTNKTVNYTVTLTGDSKVNQNYALVDEHGTPIAQLSGTGTINKARMTANVGKAQRDFDNTSTIHKTDITGGVTLNGVGSESLTLSNGALDKLNGQYGTGTENAFTPDPHAGHKAVKYQGMQDALQYMADHGTAAEKKIAQNYTIADTLYFAEAADKGEIKPLAIIAANVHKQENYAVKEYDGSTSLNGATFYKDNTKAEQRDKGLQFYARVGGQDIEIMYEGTGAYADKNAGKGNRTINYTVTGIKTDFSGDYVLDPTAQSMIVRNHSVAGNTITPRTIKVKTDVAYDKIYDGTKTVYDAGGNLVNSVQYEGLLEADRNQGVKVTTDSMAYDSENANADPEGNVSGANHVNAAVKIENGNGNYTLEDTDDATAVVTTKTFNMDGKIRQRVVYVDFKAGKGTEATNHKTYDGTAGLGHNALDDVEMKGRDDARKTGVIAGDNGNVQLTNATGAYSDKNVARKDDGTVTTKEVYYQNFQLTDSKAGNYAVQAAPEHQKEGDKTTLAGRGVINPKTIHAALNHDTGINKAYDGTTAVTDPKSNVRIQAGDLVGSDTVDSIGLDVERAVYRENPDGTGDEVKDAGKNGGANDALGVDYVLKWTGEKGNYELASFSLKGKGKITRRTLHYAGGTPHTEKVYDGTDAVKQAEAAKAFANAFNDAVYRKDYTENPNIAVTTARYTDGVNASVDNQTETPANHTVDYTITLSTNNAYGTSNFQMDPSGALTDTQHGTGTITRRTLHMDVPSEMAPNDTAAEPVPTLRPLTGETGLISPDVPPNVHIQWEGGKTWAEIRNTPGVYHYQWIADDGSAAGLYGQNYIFRPGTLTVGVTLPGDYQAALADRDFVPDHLSYQRASRDWDATHFYRMSAIELRHEKKGVNLSRVPDYGPESRIGIPASAQGARSDVSWGLSDLSAYRETEEPSVDLTEAAREAAMALESQDAGVSRIEEKTEPSLRPVASAAASDTAEPTGWLASLPSAAAVSDVPAALGIRINAQDEDVDEAMLVAAEPDRNLHIGIETMGGAVNMMAMR